MFKTKTQPHKKSHKQHNHRQHPYQQEKKRLACRKSVPEDPNEIIEAIKRLIDERNYHENQISDINNSVELLVKSLNAIISTLTAALLKDNAIKPPIFKRITPVLCDTPVLFQEENIVVPSPTIYKNTDVLVWLKNVEEEKDEPVQLDYDEE